MVGQLFLLVLLCASTAATPRRRRRHVGRWSAAPQFTPTCECGELSADEVGIDYTRNFCCGAYPGCPPQAITPIVPPSGLPNYTKDGRRDHHHVPDGPIVGNGNIGVVVGAGNLWNVSFPWLDIFISANAFWALTVANHTQGSPFRGRNALPGTMQLGVARLNLPADFAGCTFAAEQDFDHAKVTVNLTSAVGAVVSLQLWVSPRAPVIWSKLSSSGHAAPLSLSLNTTVRSMFYHRDTGFRYNASFPLATGATCGPEGSDASVSRATDFSGARVPAARANGGSASVTGAIYHTLRPAASSRRQRPMARNSCVVQGKTSATLKFQLPPHTQQIVSTVVRISRDPSCVHRPAIGSAPLCNLPTNADSAAEAIAKDFASIHFSQAEADHALHWAKFWNASSVSLPDAPGTEDFWYGAQHAINSAVPHEGQEQTPPGLYGPFGTTDNPGWHGDYTIDYVSLCCLSPTLTESLTHCDMEVSWTYYD
jgi:hypothetical protein